MKIEKNIFGIKMRNLNFSILHLGAFRNQNSIGVDFLNATIISMRIIEKKMKNIGLFVYQ